MLKQIIEVVELMDSSFANGERVKELLTNHGLESNNFQWKTIQGKKGETDFIRILIPGSQGKTLGGSAPTLGIIGRLGGIGARPERLGMVSDADGAVTVVAVALKLIVMQKNGDTLPGDVLITTHIAPHAPTQPHEPVAFMGSPVDMGIMNQNEVEASMDAILSVDTTKGNRILNHKGFAITPTVKDGWILKISEDLLSIMEWTTGRSPWVLPITMQDITPYGNDIYHVNSILQPAVAANVPVVGVAITTETAVPGCATGASHEIDLEVAARYCIEVAKAFTSDSCSFYDVEEYAAIIKRYGSMNHLKNL